MKKTILIALAALLTVLAWRVGRSRTLLPSATASGEAAEAAAVAPRSGMDESSFGAGSAFTGSEHAGQTLGSSNSFQEQFDEAWGLTGEDRLVRLRSVVLAWTKQEPEQAAAQLLKLAAGEERTQLLRLLATTWAEKEPSKAAAHLLPALEAEERLLVGGEIASVWAGKEPLDALKWLESEDESFRLTTTQLVYSRWADTHPAEAMNHAMASTTPDADQAVRIVASRWLESEPAEAVKWYESLASQERKSAVLPQMLVVLAQTDSDACLSLVNALTTPELRFEVIRQAVPALSAIHSQLALDLAGRLPSGEERDRLLQKVQSSQDQSSQLSELPAVTRSGP